jgi:hypothetical protein
MLRWLMVALCVGGLTLLGLSAFSYFTFGQGPALTIEETDLTCEDITPGQETTVTYQLRNNSWCSIRVVGLAEC